MGGEFLDRVVRSFAFTHQLRSNRTSARQHTGNRAERHVCASATLTSAYTDGPTCANIDHHRHAGAHRNASAVAHQHSDHTAYPHPFTNNPADRLKKREFYRNSLWLSFSGHAMLADRSNERKFKIQ